MAKRLDKTEADYLAIALAPALIMVLVGSLVFFLTEVFYQGLYSERLHFVLALFVFAAVLVSRIAIEQSRAYAAMYAAPLGLATYVALLTFVEFEGGAASRLSWLINLMLLGIVWWAADRLVWDCTLIDEQQDASGQGLLQVAGLERPDSSGATANTGSPPPSGAIAPPGRPTHTPSQPHEPAHPLRAWWERHVERRGKPHAPGLWIIYFSLAALPIFGLGQGFIPADDLERRRYVFRLFIAYMGSGLGLLMTTSFLGLRRYLRQRRLQMPGAMAGTWITLGALLIVALLVFCAFIPRPSAEYKLASLDFSVTSPDRDASRYGWGNEGAKDDRRDARGSGRDRQGRLPPSRQGPGQSTSDPQNQATQPGQRGQPPASGKPPAHTPSSGNQSGGGQSRGGSSGDREGTSNVSATGQSTNNGGSKSTPAPDKPVPSQPRQQPPENSQDGGAKTAGSPNGGSPRAGSHQGDTPQANSKGEESRQGDPQATGNRPQPNQSGGQADRRSQGASPRQDSASQQGSPGDGSAQGQTRQGDSSSGPSGGARRDRGTGRNNRRPTGGPPEPDSKSQPSEPSDSSDPGDEPAAEEGGRSGSSSFEIPEQLLQPITWISLFFRWTLYSAIALVLVGAAWYYRRELAAACRDLLQALRNLWALIHGGKKQDHEPAGEATPPPAPPLPFAAYADPFQSGAAAKYSPPQLVAYSFTALEAWARDRGCARSCDQTPHEFAWQVGQHEQALARSATELADLYCQAAYASQKLPRHRVDSLRELWRKLRESYQQPTAATTKTVKDGAAARN
jgi:hypothetical protein